MTNLRSHRIQKIILCSLIKLSRRSLMIHLVPMLMTRNKYNQEEKVLMQPKWCMNQVSTLLRVINRVINSIQTSVKFRINSITLPKITSKKQPKILPKMKMKKKIRCCKAIQMWVTTKRGMLQVQKRISKSREVTLMEVSRKTHF